jgi:hypothetical protein
MPTLPRQAMVKPSNDGLPVSQMIEDSKDRKFEEMRAI